MGRRNEDLHLFLTFTSGPLPRLSEVTRLYGIPEQCAVNQYISVQFRLLLTAY